MPRGLLLHAAPEGEPVTLAELKAQLSVDHDYEDDLLTALGQSARQACEVFCGRAFITQTWRLVLEEFPYGCDSVIRLPWPRLLSVSSVRYRDTTGTWQTLTEGTDYSVYKRAEPGRVRPAYGTSWPATRAEPESVEIVYRAGYGGPAEVPEPVKQAVKVTVRRWYDGPGGDREIPEAAKSLLWPYWHGAIDA